MSAGRRPWSGLVALLLLVPACGDEQGGATPPAERPNVLVITLDTCRADHLGLYGYARDTTPRLDAFAERCVVFERAFSNSSFTPPSHASILTSRYPAEHGMMHWSYKLGDVPTAADLFSAAGYRTGAFSPLPTLFSLGLDRGFDTTDGPEPDGSNPKSVIGIAEDVNALASPWLLDPTDSRPFFSWIHYYDAHRPFARQGEPWRSMFSDYEDPTVGDLETWYQLDAADRERLGLDGGMTAHIKDRYDGGLVYLDEHVGRLLEQLEAAGVLDHTVVVITADHGEVLDEYPEQWFSHDPWLVDENTHVPFLLHLPGDAHAGARISSFVEGVDVLPTILAAAGLDGVALGLELGLERGLQLSGQDLHAVLDGEPSSWRPFVYADRIGDPRSEGKTPEQVAEARDRKRMIRTDSHKYVRFTDRHRDELWALEAETVDVAERERETVDQLRRALAEVLRFEQRNAIELTPSDDADSALLDQLGYTGNDEDENLDSEEPRGTGSAPSEAAVGDTDAADDDGN